MEGSGLQFCELKGKSNGERSSGWPHTALVPCWIGRGDEMKGKGMGRG